MNYLGYPLFIVSFVVVLWGIGALVASALLGMRTRRVARVAREKLEFEGSTSGFVLARGKIVATGGGVGPAASGPKTVVSARLYASEAGTAGVAEGEAASDGLAILVDGARTPLDGRVELVAGSRWRWRRASPQRGFYADCVLVEGDEVFAAVRAPAGYRKEDSPAPPSEQGLVRIAATAPPSVRGALPVHLMARIAIGVALIGLVPGWMLGKGYATASKEAAASCRAYGTCGVGLEISGKRLWKGEIFKPRARTDADCLASEWCARLGQCSLKDGHCAATKDEDCRLTPLCVTSGFCAAVDGGCARTRSEDCPRAECLSEGRCSLLPGDRGCGPVTDADCADSFACKSDLRCVVEAERCERPKGTRTIVCDGSSECLRDGRCEQVLDIAYCTASTPAHCQNSRECGEQGQCNLVGGECKSGHVHCRESDACRIHGRCEDDGLGCRAASDADCKASTRCKELGACKKIGDECTKEDCSTSFACKLYGACGLTKDGCARPTAEGCKASLGCIERGNCTVAENACVAGSDADCAPTEGCKKSGRCTAKNGDCVVGSPKDCAATTNCTLHGACTPGSYACVVGSDADCQRSLGCKIDGECIADGLCRTPQDDRRCRDLPECTTLGRCAWESFRCVAKRDEDCKASVACKERGYCTVEKAGPLDGDSYCFLTP